MVLLPNSGGEASRCVTLHVYKTWYTSTDMNKSMFCDALKRKRAS